MNVLSDPRWLLIQARDARADGRFWYSVATTGIFCRPSCPSRAARPENVQIHASLEEARATGFRPCRRCHPELANAPAADLVERTCRRLEDGEGVTLAGLAAAEQVSPTWLHRLFKAQTGLTPRAYAAAHRAERLRSELGAGTAVTAAIHAAGFGSSGRFYANSDALLGMVPSRARCGGAGEVLRVLSGASSLGHVLVAMGERGVAAVLLGDDLAALEADLRRRFPAANLAPPGDGDGDALARVLALVEQPAAGLDLPLDIRGTAFQARVWAALRALLSGETVTYGALARRLGHPRAARAVAAACAANPLAVAVPCHRVLGAKGGLGGYRWGVARKRALLDREAVDREG